MGYQLKSEYTLELIKNPQAYNYIDNQFFLTGFILATGFDESALEALLNNWKEIDLITSGRIRFLFYIDNEKDLMGWPHRPYFSEAAYKKYNNTLLQTANRYNFNVSIKPGTQLSEPNGKEWYPQENVLKLARSLGLSGDVPCLVWTTFNTNNILYYKKLKDKSPVQILSEIKEFCHIFYDENAAVLNEIDKLESAIEDKCGSLNLSISGFKAIRSQLEAVIAYRQVMLSLKEINWQCNWKESLIQLQYNVNQIISLGRENEYFSPNLLNRLNNWIDKSIFIDKILNNLIPFGKIPSNHICNSLIDSLSFYKQLPDDAIQISSKKLPEATTEIFKNFVLIFGGYSEMDSGQLLAPKLIKGRLGRLLEFCKTNFSGESIDLTLENIHLTTLCNILSTIEAIYVLDDLTDRQNTYRQNITALIKSFFYENNMTNGMTIQFWLYYKYKQHLGDVEKYVQDVVEVTKNRAVNTQEVSELLDQVNRFSSHLKFNNIDKYSKRLLPETDVLLDRRLNTEIPVTKLKSNDTEEKLQDRIRDTLIPIAHVMANFNRGILDDEEQKIVLGIKERISVLNIIHTDQYTQNVNQTVNNEIKGNAPTVIINHAAEVKEKHEGLSNSAFGLSEQPANMDDSNSSPLVEATHPSISISGKNPLIHIKHENTINQNNTHHHQMEKKNNPWISGSFYLVVIVVILSILMVMAKMLPLYIFPIVLIGGVMLFTAVSVFQIYNDDRISEKSFLTVMGMIFKQIPILASAGKQVAKRKTQSKGNDNAGGEYNQ
ncbi:MAG TPA: hypothetical protein VK668_16290 [Mucilaginibacter sp.]|nr:hypothetical protein [Mucilaginibacter sp.]